MARDPKCPQEKEDIGWRSGDSSIFMHDHMLHSTVGVNPAGGQFMQAKATISKEVVDQEVLHSTAGGNPASGQYMQAKATVGKETVVEGLNGEDGECFHFSDQKAGRETVQANQETPASAQGTVPGPVQFSQAQPLSQ